MGGIGCDDLADDQPVEQHADGGEVLLDGRLLEVLAERLDVGRDMHRLDVGELAELVALAPGEEAPAGVEVGRAGVLVVDRDGEEFQEAARRRVAGVGDDRRHDDRRPTPRRAPWGAVGIELAARAWFGLLSLACL